MASVMTATLSVGVSAAPAKAPADGREDLHSADQNSLSRFGSDQWRYLPFPDTGLQWPPQWPPKWPPFGLGKSAKVETPGTEDRHTQEQHFLYFFGSDMWPNWAFAHAGVLWSPAGLSNEGLTLKLLAIGGVYRYVSGTLDNTTIFGRQSSMTVMPGWRFKLAGYEVTIFAGLDVQQFQFIPDDPGTNLRGRHMCLRGAFELWHEPSPTTKLAADASISTICAGNSARIAYGWRVLESFYLGPEAQVYYTNPYFHARAGAVLWRKRH